MNYEPSRSEVNTSGTFARGADTAGQPCSLHCTTVPVIVASRGGGIDTLGPPTDVTDRRSRLRRRAGRSPAWPRHGRRPAPASRREATSKRNRDLSCEFSKLWKNVGSQIPVQVSSKLSQEPCRDVEPEAVPARKGANETLQGVRHVRVRAEMPQQVTGDVLRVASDSRAVNPRVGLSLTWRILVRHLPRS